MRRSRLLVPLAAALLLAGCAGGDGPSDEPASPEEASSAAEEPTEDETPPEEDATPDEAEEPQEPVEPAEPPTVEGEWAELDLPPMTSNEDIGQAPLPQALKLYLEQALLDEIIYNEEFADEFPDCPVEASVTAYHPAGFAVVGIAGCGPTGQFGIVTSANEMWEPAAMVGEEPPTCQELADAGVPGDVPYAWDDGFRCSEGNEYRYW